MMRGLVLLSATGVLGLPVAVLASAPTAPPASELMFDPALLADEVPAAMLDAYLSAASRWDVDWAVLAAIGKVECDHGRSPLAGCAPAGTVNTAGARGPMQFLGSTWRADADRYALDVAGPPTADGRGYATDGDGDGIADPWTPLDATHAAARYLRDLDVARDPWEAARSYNAGPASPTRLGAGYADRVTAIATSYREAAGWAGPGSDSPSAVNGWSLPFHPAGLVTRAARGDVDPLTLITKPHHSGRVAVDIPLPVGTPIRALHDGTILVARTAGNCGTTLIITIDGAAGATVNHCHLAGITVKPGTHVTAGQMVGTSGGQPGTPGAGSSTGPHLHLHIVTTAGRRCPQPLLAALWLGELPPDLDALPLTGCTYRATAGSGAAAPIPRPPVPGGAP